MERAFLVTQLLSILLRTYGQLAKVARCERDSVVVELEYDATCWLRAYRDVKLGRARSQNPGRHLRERELDVQRRLTCQFQFSNAP